MTFPYQFPANASRIQPLSHGGTSFWSGAEIIQPPVFIPTIVIGSPAQIDALLTVDFLSVPGAYLFIRQPRSIMEPVRVRIGEGASVASRLEGKRDEWLHVGFNLAICITCKHPLYDKTFAEVTEARLTAIIEGSRSAAVERERAPKLRRLPPEAEQAMDAFIQLVRAELERRNIFLLTQSPPAHVTVPQWHPEPFIGGQSDSHSWQQHPWAPEGERENTRVLALVYNDLVGELVENADHVVIRRGTEVSPHEVAALQTASRKARRKLIGAGIIVPHPTKQGLLAFALDHRMGSLTAAARVVTGSTQSGTHVWRARPSEH